MPLEMEKQNTIMYYYVLCYYVLKVLLELN